MSNLFDDFDLDVQKTVSSYNATGSQTPTWSCQQPCNTPPPPPPNTNFGCQTIPATCANTCGVSCAHTCAGRPGCNNPVF